MKFLRKKYRATALAPQATQEFPNKIRENNSEHKSILVKVKRSLSSSIKGKGRQHLSKHSSRRGVRFSSSNEIFIVPHLEDYTVDERNSLWYGSKISEKMINVGKDLGSALSRHKPTRNFMWDLINASYHNKDKSFFSEEYIQQINIRGNDDIYHFCNLNEKNGSEIFLNLIDWCNNNTRRGLENAICPKFHYNAIDSVRAVTDRQRFYIDENFNQNGECENDRLIRIAYAPCTIAARRLALAYGAADAIASRSC